MFRFIPLALILISTTALGGSIDRKVKKLSDTEFDHFYALRTYMSEDDQKSYLKLKTEEERNAWLVDKGLWDAFYKYDQATRDAIVAEAFLETWGPAPPEVEMFFRHWSMLARG